ncbi:MAG: hypothetical protein ACP6IU_05715 [Candidatus Asgardarchaeia archaeon]
MKEFFVKDILKVGKKGEIYTSKKIREVMKLKTPGKVIAIAKEGELIIKVLKPIEQFISEPPVIKINVDELEKVSEDVQKEYIDNDNN